MDRVYNADECRQITDKYPDYFTFDSDKWFSVDANYAIKEGENIGFAEYKSPGTYWVHFCFHTARGREAIDLTKKMVANLYNDCPIRTAIGLITKNNRKARWLIRQVGFKSLGFVETKIGLCEMFYYTKDEQYEFFFS